MGEHGRFSVIFLSGKIMKIKKNHELVLSGSQGEK